MKRWWVSWYEPVDGSQDFRPFLWPLPSGIDKYWCSGWTGDMDAATLCAVVDAPDERSAKRLIGKAWKHSRKKIEWRFCNEVGAGWWPNADRFPRTTSPPVSK